MATQQTAREREAQSKARVDRLIGLIRDIKNGVPQEGRPEVTATKILPSDYRALLDRLKSPDKDISGYFHKRLQYEYRPSLTSSTQFSIRKNSTFHNGMKTILDYYVARWLNHIAVYAFGKYASKTVELADNIYPCGSGVLGVGEKYLRADSAWKYWIDEAGQPDLIIEVAWSQSTKSLREKAREFIHESGGEIRTVLGLDLSGTYNTWNEMKRRWDSTGTPQRGAVCVFVWRAVFDDETGEVSLDDGGQPNMTESSHIFCNDDGEVNWDERVCLKLQDMIPESILRQENNSIREELASIELVIGPSTLMGDYKHYLRDQKRVDDRKKLEKG